MLAEKSPGASKSGEHAGQSMSLYCKINYLGKLSASEVYRQKYVFVTYCVVSSSLETGIRSMYQNGSVLSYMEIEIIQFPKGCV